MYSYVSNGEEVRIVPRIVEEISRNTRIRMKKEAPCLVLSLVPLENLEPWGKNKNLSLCVCVSKFFVNVSHSRFPKRKLTDYVPRSMPRRLDRCVSLFDWTIPMYLSVDSFPF